MRTNATPKSLPQIAVKTQDLKARRIQVVFQPLIHTVSACFDTTLASMFRSVIIYMVYAKKMMVVHTTTGTFTPIGGENSHPHFRFVSLVNEVNLFTMCFSPFAPISLRVCFQCFLMSQIICSICGALAFFLCLRDCSHTLCYSSCEI